MARGPEKFPLIDGAGWIWEAGESVGNWKNFVFVKSGMNRQGWLFLGLWLLLPSLVWAKAKPEPPKPIDQLYRLLEHDSFRSDKCKNRYPGVVCAIVTDKIELFAEADGPDGFLLYVNEREVETAPVSRLIVQIKFASSGGMTLTDVTDYYNRYPDIRRGKGSPVVVRRWLQDIQKVLDPNFRFAPLEQ
ncbi:MAG: hypothetical protein A2600_12490 [Candidatus Lambdaproteobacteria bacterium RIFOXYD1_FULL_56_27]|uniref:Uncharacterized protein n=1 Tax=Candidatus Lambdaproteobacteria bacterium RIFOXYD2_FULL_56_26 TaxID=1817773 RepID=A0A1F6GSX6_9PROT|nr:MAG: hypothetical protein A2426_00095 [Candidatus Lambdaproteobacteria bacterium RIFOXYC1_FULL_56_13]OGH01188.1 MAG: hypothetical protein A2557_01585 [Candidatus Lambdaproteobacteria bacterium RIFOXYD2_FULL_56_26]OGH06458.1 MAG: hypothetical protein A2600_12490 [Candidatus Lambdaproteobacteria bacterium RIFOXYD1_FULL_56_27]